MAMEQALDWLTASSVLNFYRYSHEYSNCSWRYDRKRRYAPVPEWIFEKERPKIEKMMKEPIRVKVKTAGGNEEWIESEKDLDWEAEVRRMNMVLYNEKHNTYNINCQLEDIKRLVEKKPDPESKEENVEYCFRMLADAHWNGINRVRSVVDSLKYKKIR